MASFIDGMKGCLLLEIQEQRISTQVIQSSPKAIAIETDADCFNYRLYYRLYGSVSVELFQL